VAKDDTEYKQEKVYKVTTAWIDQDDNESINDASYNVVAVDVESAIMAAKKFFRPREYAESVELVTYLD